MASLSLSFKSPAYSFSLYRSKPSALSLLQPAKRFNLAPRSFSSSSVRFNPLRLSSGNERMMVTKKKGRGSGVVCYASPLTVRNLQWISAISTAVLMLARGTPIPKSFLVPLFALQAPGSFISWMKGEYGIWSAFLALLVRLFFSIPGELELPFVALMLVIIAPHQVMSLRGTKEGTVISLVIAGYLAFQHFSRTGSLRKAFDQGSIVATLAIACVIVATFLLLI